MQIDWSSDNVLKVGSEPEYFDGELHDADEWRPRREKIEPWLAAVFQSEHLSLLVGNGLTAGVAHAAGVSASSMAPVDFGADLGPAIDQRARESAEKMGRGEPNLEDQLRVAIELATGLSIVSDPRAAQLYARLDEVMSSLLESILDTERKLADALEGTSEEGRQARVLLGSFVLSFASRAASRDRLHVFTTNYDRVLEFAFEDKGVFALDRFRGVLSPRYTSSRMDLDMHYNPPGMKGEPRYVEGVVRFTKIHGSVDWRFSHSDIVREPLPFGAASDHPALPSSPLDSVAVYPNSSKDIETAFHPYADLFRDFSAATCRPNSAVVTYGYGFGDSHINRVLEDMLSIPSSHLVVISHSDAGGRIPSFVERLNPAQVTLLVGPELGGLSHLVNRYLPKSAIDNITHRKAELLKWRGESAAPASAEIQGPDNV